MPTDPTDLVDHSDAEVVGLLFGAAIAQVAERLEADRGIPAPGLWPWPRAGASGWPRRAPRTPRPRWTAWPAGVLMRPEPFEDDWPSDPLEAAKGVLLGVFLGLVLWLTLVGIAMIALFTIPLHVTAST